MDRWMDWWTGKWIIRWTADGLTDGRDGLTDGWMGVLKDRQMDLRKDRWINRQRDGSTD